MRNIARGEHLGLRSGDTIVDTFGDPIIHYDGPGAGATCTSSQENWQKMIAGEMTVDEWTNNSMLRVDTQIAFDHGLPLPEGVSIIHGPSYQERYEARMRQIYPIRSRVAAALAGLSRKIL